MKRRHFIGSSIMALGGLSSANIIIPKLNKRGLNKKLGVALVGLGYYSTDLLAPALQRTRNCELKGIVTGSPWKIPVWQKKYGIRDKNVYNYQSMPEIANNEDIDIIYIVLPTGMHSDYAVMAAEAGKHVWCEKPMARTVEECENIINACRKNQVKLSIGYRMQHEPNTRTIINYGKIDKYGKIQNIQAEAGYYEGRTDHWKLKKEMGGGAMYDMGVYPLNAMRYSSQMEPLAVEEAKHTTTRPDIYTEVDETTDFVLRFPGDIIAKGRTSFGHGFNRLEINCTEGWYELSPFQAYSGIKGRTSNGILLNQTIPNQQAHQMDNDAAAILHNRDVLVPGEEGCKDIRIVQAIYESAAKGQAVDL